MKLGFDILGNLYNLAFQATDRTKMTALHAAASNGAYKVCELLLENGANLRCCDEEDMTPLHFAAMEGHHGTRQYLPFLHLTLAWIILKNGHYTFEILRCEHSKIFKICLAIFQQNI